MESFYQNSIEFKTKHFQKLQPSYEALKDSQKPKSLILSCADSRVNPNEFTLAEPGEVFSIRNAGNLIQEYDPKSPTNEAVTLEYGVEVLEIPEIIVCGHRNCGAMGGVLNFEGLSGLPTVQQGLKPIHDLYQAEFTTAPTVDELIEWNVKKQMQNILSYPFVAKRVEQGKLQVWGWVWDFVNAKVSFRIHHSELDANLEVKNA